MADPLSLTAQPSWSTVPPLLSRDREPNDLHCIVVFKMNSLMTQNNFYGLHNQSIMHGLIIYAWSCFNYTVTERTGQISSSSWLGSEESGSALTSSHVSLSRVAVLLNKHLQGFLYTCLGGAALVLLIIILKEVSRILSFSLFYLIARRQQRAMSYTVTLQKGKNNMIGISIGGGSPYCSVVYIVQVRDCVLWIDLMCKRSYCLGGISCVVIIMYRVVDGNVWSVVVYRGLHHKLGHNFENVNRNCKFQ